MHVCTMCGQEVGDEGYDTYCSICGEFIIPEEIEEE